MNKWKVTAIIFIILFLVETLSVIYLISVGMKISDDTAICSNEICYNQGYSSFSYNQYSGVCSCYDDAGILKDSIKIT